MAWLCKLLTVFLFWFLSFYFFLITQLGYSSASPGVTRNNVAECLSVEEGSATTRPRPCKPPIHNTLCFPIHWGYLPERHIWEMAKPQERRDWIATCKAVHLSEIPVLTLREQEKENKTHYVKATDLGRCVCLKKGSITPQRSHH